MNADAIRQPLAMHLLPEGAIARPFGLVLLALAGSLVLWASAKISVPFFPVPMTLQTGAVAMLAAFYGWRLGAATVLVYLTEGAMGLPVFQGTPQQGIGLAYMMGPTGGYLFGMVVQAGVIGWLAERGFHSGAARLFGAMMIGDAVLFAIGLAWLGSVIGWDKPVLALGLYPFLLGDLVKMALAACLVTAGIRLVRR
jgi:biotin transport system substrate-specific component